MKIEKFVIGMIGTNCYLVQNEKTKECFLIDPAVCPPELVDHIKSKGLDLKAILLTHGHFDHIMGINDFLAEFPVPVYAHEDEKTLLEDASMNASANYGRGYTFSGAEYLQDGQRLTLAGMNINVIHTPGHTAGGCCYYISEENVLFSGDTLFHTSIGRTDLPTGSSSQLTHSIRERLMCLPGETTVYPGHMSETSIAFEEMNNPYF